MKLTTKLTHDDVAAIVAAVAEETYGGNVVAEVDHMVTHTRGKNAGRHVYRVKLNARDSRGIGARRSWSGRRGPWTCWHAFRDVFAAWYAADPRAIVRTGIETYRDAAHFLDTFPATGNRNAGSVAQPAALADLCGCEADDGRDLDTDARDYVAELEEAHHLRNHFNYAAAYGPTGTQGV